MLFRVMEYGFTAAGNAAGGSDISRHDESMFPPVGSGSTERLFIICDGMGADGARHAASSAVCDSLTDSLRNVTGKFNGKRLADAISKAYKALDASDTGEYQHMGTTLALLRLISEGAVIAHIGNSRVYHIRPGHTPETTEILYHTKDHTYGNMLVQKGECTPEEALYHPKRNALTRAILPHMQKKCVADTRLITDIRAGDYFYLCTHGMSEMVNDDYLKYIFSHDGGSIRNKRGLLEKASAKGTDNRSAILINIIEVMREVDDTIQEINIDIEKESNKTHKKKRIMTTTGQTDAKVSLPLIFLLAFIALMSILMMVYSLFIREDEVLQQAGTAVDQPIYQEAEETYGYEITPQDIVNEATLIAPEESVEEETPEEVPVATSPSSQSEGDKKSNTPSDEPILQM